MNNRNEQDKRNYIAFLEYFGLLFYLAVAILIVVSIAFVQSGHRNTLKTKEKATYENTVVKDWEQDSTMTDRKRETLNEILAR